MPQWAGSSWYYLAYLMRDNQNSNRLPAQAGQPADKIQNYKEVFDKWLPVDMYVGGAEHVTRHMIYARFWHKFLQDIGVVTSPEPFLRYRSVGLVLAEDGRKMSKRWNNVINPDDIVISHGADALRLYEMFMGPFDQAVAWNTQGLSGVRKFLDKVNNLSDKLSNRADSQELERLLHKTIKKVANDIESFNFNTAVSAMMILVNKLTELGGASQANFETLLIILSPFAPYLTEELWHRLGHTDSIYQQAWPIYRAELAKDDEITLVIQVNGKVRDTLLVASDLTQEQAEAVARTSQKVMNHLISKPKKIIYIQNKLISFVL
jgi:leucyl-tRNA synthetase